MVAPLPFPDFGTGSCINCGYLTYLRSALNAVSRDEAVERMRAEADFPGGWAVCFVRKASIPEEMAKLEREGVPGDQRLRDILQRGRHCDTWIQWRPGFDPSEHFADEQVRLIEESRRRFEEAMENRRREFELTMERGRQEWERQEERERRAFDETLAAQSDAIATRSNRLAIYFGVFALVLVAVDVAVAVLLRGGDVTVNLR